MQKAITVLIYGGLGTVKSTLAAAYFLRECIGKTATLSIDSFYSTFDSYWQGKNRYWWVLALSNGFAAAS